MSTVHTMRAPPPLAESLHWFTMNGNALFAVLDGETEQVIDPPPPLTLPLHCVTPSVEASAVAGSGVHTRTSPVVRESLHWLMTAGVVVASPVTVLTTVTVHS